MKKLLVLAGIIAIASSIFAVANTDASQYGAPEIIDPQNLIIGQSN